MSFETSKAYDNICDQWDEYRHTLKINPCIVEFTKELKSGANILDVGCGTGYPIAMYLDFLGFHVTGIDISKEMIKRAKNLHLQHSHFYLTDLLEFEEDKQYDAIIAFDSLWHIAHQKQAYIYSKVSSLLNSGGYFLFTHGKSNGETTGKMFGEQFYYSSLDVTSVHQLLVENHFTIISSKLDFQELETGDRELLMIARKK